MRSRFARVQDHFLLVVYFVQSNRKALTISIIGLVIALSVIAENSLLLNSYRNEFFIQEGSLWGVSGNIVGDLRLQVWSTFPQTFANWANTEIFRSLTTHALSQSNYDSYIRKQCWSTTIDFFRLFYNETGDEASHNLALKIPDQQFITQARPLIRGRWPIHTREVLLIKSMEEEEEGWGMPWEKMFPAGLDLGQLLKVNLGTTDGLPSSQNVTLTVVGVLDYQTTTNPPDLATELVYNYFREDYRYDYSTHFIVIPPDLLSSLIEELNPPDSTSSQHGFATGRLFLDYSQIDGFSVDAEIEKLTTFQAILQGVLADAGYYLRFTDEFQWALELFKSSMQAYSMLFYILSIPTMGIALYLVIYSYGLIKRQKRRQVGILKTRGGSSGQVGLFLSGEVLVGSALAIVGGGVLGYLLAGLAVRSIDILNFLGVGSVVLVSERVFTDLIVWGSIFGLSSHIILMLRLSRLSIRASEEPLDKQPPLWSRYYLDLWATILGGIGLFLIFTLFSQDVEGLPDLVYEVAPLLMIPAPFLSLIGLIFLLSRFFPLITKVVANYLWKWYGGVTSFALKNVVRHKYAANRAVIIVTLTLTYAIFLGLFAHFVESYTEQIAYYNYGADVVVSSWLNDTLQTQLEMIPGVHTVSAFVQGYSWETVNPFVSCLFVDPTTFEGAAYFKKYFGLNAPLPQLLQILTDNTSILIASVNLKASPLYWIGGNFTLSASNVFSLQIAGTFRYWPRLAIDVQEYAPLNHFWVIGSLGLFYNLQQYNLLNVEQRGYYLSLQSDALYSNVISAIDSIPQVNSIYSPIEDIKWYLESFVRKFLLSVLNSNLVISMLIAIVSITMFAFFTLIDRNKEIGVERVLGMTRIQLGHTFFVEGSLIMVFGVLIGMCMGLFYSSLVIRLFTLGQDFFPFFLIFPLNFFFTLIGGIIGVAAIGTLLPAFLAMNQSIQSSLRSE